MVHLCFYINLPEPSIHLLRARARLPQQHAVLDGGREDGGGDSGAGGAGSRGGALEGGHWFYPHISGVALSWNHYPIEPQRAEDGVAQLALGLGHIIVGGGRSVRFSPGCPGVLPHLTSPIEFLPYSQKHFLALDLQEGGDGLVSLDLSEAERHGTLGWVASVYSVDDDQLRDNLRISGPRVVTFSNILRWGAIPLAEALDRLLELLREGMGSPVEIEFAVDFTCALHRKRPPLGKRGQESLAGAVMLCIPGHRRRAGGHKKESSLCPDIDAALEILGNWVPPTAIVLTGGGIHVYWRLARPWIIDSEESRAACKEFHKRFQSIFRTADVNPHGYQIDDTHNLAQILRVPGTLNWKSGEPRPVKLHFLHDLEYSASDLGELLPELVVPIVREPTGPKKLNETASSQPLPSSSLSLRGAMNLGGSPGSSNLPNSPSSPKPATASTIRKTRRYVAKFEPGITGTALGRHNYGFRAVLKMIGHPFYLSDSEALEVLRDWAGRCDPPFTERELLDMMKAHRRRYST